MFCYNCYINIFSEELCRKLERLGYKKYKNLVDNEDSNSSIIICSTDGYYVIYDKSIVETLDESYINCNNNENLFLSISSIRSDIDKSQWFTDGIVMLKCNYDKFEDLAKYRLTTDKTFVSENFHKATIDELIEHFN